MLKTILQTLPGYVLTVILVYFTFVLLPMLFDALTFSDAEIFSAPWLTGFVLSTGVEAYATIVAMLVTGLYYHHFKARFAWSWG
jgi:hypothetical protein